MFKPNVETELHIKLRTDRKVTKNCKFDVKKAGLAIFTATTTSS